VSTLAGKARSPGYADGSGTATLFDDPTSVACDATGNLYVTDTWSATIRKITPAGEVTTVAGTAGSMGSADGKRAEARFYFPIGIACDTAGNLYVTDAGNYTIRKITPGGDVTTLAGKAGDSGSTDGNAAEARFQQARAIACDAAGNLYVADSGSDTIRRMTPAGEVTTLAGKHSSIGSTDGSGAAARFDFPTGIVCDATGDLYVSDSQNHTIRKITLSH